MAGLLSVALAASAGVQASGELRPTPPAFVPPIVSKALLDQAVRQLPGIVDAIRQETGVPGIAVTVVYRDAVAFMEGFGLRTLGRAETVDATTVFQIASVSKPMASTVVAAAVGRGLLGWDSRVAGAVPGFALGEPLASEHVTVADMLSHGSGLRTSAGDLLEDLGFDRAHILGRLRLQPLEPFRSSYNYSNFGFTAGAEAAARAAGKSWQLLANELLFEPAGMTRSSFLHADYLGHGTRAHLHVRVSRNGTTEWQPRHDRKPDPQAPAGGASSSIADVARFMRLQLGGGMLDGRRIVDADALAVTHLPHRMSRPPRTPLSRAGFYGLGWGVGYDDAGRLELSHSGAFYLGAATHVLLLPGEQLGIAVLTNGEPIGVPEAIARTFLDVVENGRQTVDWLGLFGGVFQAARDAERAAFVRYDSAPADARTPGPLAGYAGVYDNPYYGPLKVTISGDRLAMSLGPVANPVRVDLTPFDGDSFVFETFGENAVGRAGVAFVRDGSDRVSSVTVDFYDRTGLGSFERAK